MGNRKACVTTPETSSYYTVDTDESSSSFMNKKGAKTALSLGGIVSAVAAAAPLIAKLPLNDLAASAKDKAATAKDAAADGTAKGIDKGVESAVPAAQTAVDGVGTANDKMHDMIESLLSTISTKLDKLPDAKDELIRSAPLLKDTSVAKSKKGGSGITLITIGLLALAGAGAAYYLSQKKNDDPWAVAEEDLDDATYATTYTEPAYTEPTPTYAAQADDTEVITTTTVTPAYEQTGSMTNAANNENLLVENELGRPNDPLNPTPQGYANGIDNEPRTDSGEFRGGAR